MAEYDIDGKLDSDGTFHGTISERSYDSLSGNGAGGLLTVIIVYALCIFGGISMIKHVAAEAPICIIPATLAFIIMLIPIIIALGSGKFFLSLLVYLYKWSDVIIGLLVSFYWIVYVFESVSTTALYIMAFALIYLTAVTGIRIFIKLGGWALSLSLILALATYLITLACSSDFEIGYLALIPTVMIMCSIIIGSISEILSSERLLWKIASLAKLVIFVGIAILIVSLLPSVENAKTEKIQIAKDHIAAGEYSEARQALQDIKSDEAKELYASVRYKSLKVGEIIYNGHYNGSDRSMSENGIAFICIDVTDNKALLVCLDIIGLNEQYNGVVSEDYIKSFAIYADDIGTSPVGDKFGKFFLLSAEQYENGIQNEALREYLMHPNLSSVAKKDKKDVDNDNYKWTVAYTKYWLLNDFKKGDIGVVDLETGEKSYVSNYKNYAGIRPCYKAITE